MENYTVVRTPEGDWIDGFGEVFPNATREQSFPVGVRFYRTDLRVEYSWNGTAWVAESGGASLTVQEVDGVPAVTSVATIKVDQADGLVLTDEGSGVVRLDAIDTTISQHGLCPQLDNNANHFLDGTGAWSAPSAAPAPDSDARWLALGWT